MIEKYLKRKMHEIRYGINYQPSCILHTSTRHNDVHAQYDTSMPGTLLGWRCNDSSRELHTTGGVDLLDLPLSAQQNGVVKQFDEPRLGSHQLAVVPRAPRKLSAHYDLTS